MALAALAVCLPLSISGAQIALGLVLLALAGREARGAGRLRVMPLRLPLGLLCGLLVLSTFAGGPTVGALDAYRELWVTGAYVGVVCLLEGSEDGARFARILVVCATLVAVYGIAQHVTGVDAYRQLVGRPSVVRPYEHDPSRFVVVGFFPSYLTYAHSLMAPLGWAVAAALAPVGWVLGRGLAAACAVVMATALVLSTARGAWLAAAALGVAALAVSSARVKLAAVGAAVLLASALFGLSPGLRAEARSMLDARANAGRLAIYAANLEALRHHPVLGVGFGNYDRAMRAFYRRHPGADRRSHAHNTFLQIAVQAGLLGLAGFVGLFGTVVGRGWVVLRRLRDERDSRWTTAAGAWLAVVGFLVGGLTQDTFVDSECAMAMWVAVAVLMAVWQENRGETRVADPPR
jgi:putative inorganic carbon (HCO3(-)) transporter